MIPSLDNRGQLSRVRKIASALGQAYDDSEIILYDNILEEIFQLGYSDNRTIDRYFLLLENLTYIVKANVRDCHAIRKRTSYSKRNLNTGNIINNIQRYLYFIEQKYPGMLTQVHQIGNNDQEPAWLYQINYRYYGF